MLLRMLGAGYMDQLMRTDNDLVVDVPSMRVIDPQTPEFVRDKLDLGTNDRVYHTNYFDQSEVVRALSLFLGLVTTMSTRSPVRPGSTVVGVPAAASQDFVVLDSTLPADVAVKTVQQHGGEFAVVRRRSETSESVEHYPFSKTEFEDVFSARPPHSPIADADEIQDSTSAREASPSAGLTLPGATDGPEWHRRTVIMRGGEPIGVLPRQGAPTAAAPPPARRGGRLRRSAGDHRVPPPTRGHRRSARPSGDAPVDASFRAEMPDSIRCENETIVLVDISLDDLQMSASAASAAARTTIDKSKRITVHAIPRVNVRVVGEDHATVPPPGPGQPRMLRFVVAGTLEGPGELVIAAEQGPVVLVRLVLDFTVTGDTVVKPQSTTVASATVQQPESVAPCDQLWIDEARNIANVTVNGVEQVTTVDTAFVVRYRSERLDVQERDTTKAIKGDRLAYVTKLFERIEDDWGAGQDDAAAFHSSLRAYGGQLFDELLPESIQRVLWDNRDRIKTIQINSEDPLIPWELVHLKGPRGSLPREDRFLANMGLIRWMDNAGIPPAKVTLRSNRARVLAPQYPDNPDWKPLEEAADEYRFLKEKVRASRVKPTREALRKLIEAPGRFDLLHFAGHGYAIPADIGHASLVLDVRWDGGEWVPISLESTFVEQYANLRTKSGNRPLVFLNACQTGRAGYQLTGIGGFAQAFISRGAGIFVSSLWSVGDEPAKTFCESFYAALLAGKTVVEATTAARHKSRLAGDPTWLAYVVYGRPEGTLTLA
jgi:hypothetical protein